MLNRILTISIILVFFSCGEDVVEVVDTPIPNDVENIYEVNLIGFVTDSNLNFIDDADVAVDEVIVDADQSSFFLAENILIGNSGQVIKAQKEGFLPIYKRIYNHQSIEDVIVHVQVETSPAAQLITSSGGDILAVDGTTLSFEPDAIDVDTEVIFYSSSSENEILDFDPLVIDEDDVRILDSDVLFYLEFADSELLEVNMTIEVDAQNVKNIENSKLYRYNESLLSWEEEDTLVEQDGKVSAHLNQPGWWAIGESLNAVYGSVTFIHPVSEGSNMSPLNNSEIAFNNLESDRPNNEHLFTSDDGAIHKYFPLNIAQMIGLDSGSFIAEINGFTSSDTDIIFEFDQQLFYEIKGESFDCNLDLQEGYVASVFAGQYVIKKIENGSFSFFVSIDQEEINFEFYNTAEEKIASKNISSSKISEQKLSFVACAPVMEVKNENVVLQNFDKCRVRVKPIESFIVGEKESDKKVFVSFKGDEVGLYNGLVYAESVTSLDISEIENEVVVDILIYDTVTETIAGSVDGRYVSGDIYKVKFIGNIEN